MGKNFETLGRHALRRRVRRLFSDIGGYEAQFGIKKDRRPFVYSPRSKRGTTKNPNAAKRRGWNNHDILFKNLMKKQRNPFYTSKTERAHIIAIWKRAIGRAIRGRGSKASLRMGAAIVSRQLIAYYQSHMITSKTKPGQPAKVPSQSTREIYAYLQKTNNENLSRGARKDRIRESGYGVYTGQIWDAMYTGIKLISRRG